jgi:hypothetical protein
MDSQRPVEARTNAMGPAKRSVAIGPRLLIPGYPQWTWNQKDRAMVLFGSFAAAILVSVLTWGSAVGLGILAFGFAAHVFSAVDAIRQNAFPSFGRLVPTLTTSAGLGTVVYGPALAMASVFAWPVSLDERPHEVYLVNRRAYREELPRAGETVWLSTKRAPRPKVGRVLAGPGQRIEWVAGEFRVDDQLLEEKPLLESESPAELKLTIPEGHVLVVYPTDPRRGSGIPGGWEILSTRDVRGRAWARSFPIWERRMLR